MFGFMSWFNVWLTLFSSVLTEKKKKQQSGDNILLELEAKPQDFTMCKLQNGASLHRKYTQPKYAHGA